MDFSTAICDARGRIIAQGLGIPLHLGAIPDAMAALLTRFGDDIGPGDVFALNDPDEGGMHLPDIFVIKPVFAGNSSSAMQLASPTTPTSGAASPAATPSIRPRFSRKGSKSRP